MSRIWTKEQKEKMSLLAKSRGFGKWMIGKKFSEETKNKLSLIRKYKKYPGRINKGTFRKGHIHSLETRIKIGISGRKYISSNELPIDSLRNNEQNKQYYRLYRKRSIAHKLSQTARRARIKNIGLITSDIIQNVIGNNIKNFGKLTCIYCLKNILFSEISLEHKIPISRGGDNNINNLDIACLPCNIKKNRKTEEEYREYLCQK